MYVSGNLWHKCNVVHKGLQDFLVNNTFSLETNVLRSMSIQIERKSGQICKAFTDDFFSGNIIELKAEKNRGSLKVKYDDKDFNICFDYTGDSKNFINKVQFVNFERGKLSLENAKSLVVWFSGLEKPDDQMIMKLNDYLDSYESIEEDYSQENSLFHYPDEIRFIKELFQNKEEDLKKINPWKSKISHALSFGSVKSENIQTINIDGKTFELHGDLWFQKDVFKEGNLLIDLNPYEDKDGEVVICEKDLFKKDDLQISTQGIPSGNLWNFVKDKLESKESDQEINNLIVAISSNNLKDTLFNKEEVTAQECELLLCFNGQEWVDLQVLKTEDIKLNFDEIKFVVFCFY